MTEEMFSVVDRDYGRCHEISAPRKIRTKSTSFSSIFARFNAFRIKLLQKKLDRAQDKALTSDYSRNHMEKQVDKNALSIAKLEAKIMVLSKENVPANFIASRALKLRNNMFQNLNYKCGQYYSIGLDKKDEIFGSNVMDENNSTVNSVVVEESDLDESKPEIITSDSVLPAALVKDNDAERIDVVPDSLERKQIEDAVNSEFASLGESVDRPQDTEGEIEEYTSSESSTLSSEDVRSVIDESFGEIESIPEIVGTFGDENIKDKPLDDVTININTGEKKYEGDSHVQESSPSEPIMISSDEKTDSQEASSGSLESIVESNDSSTISADDIKHEINEVIEKIKVSRNEANSAKVSRYDSDGNKRSRRNEYVPMTDEEIRASQEKLGFDEHGNLLPTQTTEENQNEKMVSTASVIGENLTPFVIPNLSFDAVFVPSQNDEKVSETQLRGDTILTPDRTDSRSEEPVDSFERVDDFQMFRNDDQQNSAKSVSEHQIRRDEYNALKEKIDALKKEKEKIRRRKMAAQEAAEGAAARALEAKRMLEESQRSYDEYMDRLRAYTAELEEDCSRDLKSVELAENDAKMNESFAQMQREKADQNHRIIDEIGSLLGDVTENHSHKSK